MRWLSCKINSVKNGIAEWTSGKRKRKNIVVQPFGFSSKAFTNEECILISPIENLSKGLIIARKDENDYISNGDTSVFNSARTAKIDLHSSGETKITGTSVSINGVDIAKILQEIITVLSIPHQSPSGSTFPPLENLKELNKILIQLKKGKS